MAMPRQPASGWLTCACEACFVGQPQPDVACRHPLHSEVCAHPSCPSVRLPPCPPRRRTNHGLAAFACYAAWGVMLPATTGDTRAAGDAAGEALKTLAAGAQAGSRVHLVHAVRRLVKPSGLPTALT